MIQIANYRIALTPDADAGEFERHMLGTVFEDGQVLQATRITRSFGNTLLAAPRRQYVWQVTIDLMTDAGYDPEQNAERVQEAVAEHGVLIGVEGLGLVEGGGSE